MKSEMKILKDNYKTAGKYFETSKPLTCPRCLSEFLVEKADDVMRRETTDAYSYYVVCPCCRRENIVMKNLLTVVTDLVDDRYRTNASSYYDK